MSIFSNAFNSIKGLPGKAAAAYTAGKQIGASGAARASNLLGLGEIAGGGRFAKAMFRNRDIMSARDWGYASAKSLGGVASWATGGNAAGWSRAGRAASRLGPIAGVGAWGLNRNRR